MQSILYLLVNEEMSSFKIGITDDIETRHARLSAVWGKFDLASSRTVSGTRLHISGLEKTLHYLLEPWRIEHPIKVEGHSEWFAMACFDKALELISSAALIRGTYSESLIRTGIDLPRQKKTRKNNIYDDSSRYANNLTVLKQNWDYFEKATIDFTEIPALDDWLWTIDKTICPLSPYEFLSFEIMDHFVAFAVAEMHSHHTPWISKIMLSKNSFFNMANRDYYSEVYEFLADRITRLATLKHIKPA